MPTRKKYHFENVFSKILCFVLIVSMLPLFKIDAQAATSMRTQYVWLVSKPGIYYIYDGKNAPTAYSSYDKSHRVTMQRKGKYWVTKDYLVVDTDYDDTTVPTLPNWKNTVFEYHGVAKTFDNASDTSGPYHWAGNISGGNRCEVDDSQQGKNFCGNYISSYDVKAPSSLGAHTTYKIRFQIAADSIQITKRGAEATSNVSCFLFESKVPLPDYNGGGGSAPDPEPEDTEATAKLSISAQDVTVNYKDFEVRGEGETKVTLDPSKSSTNADWVRYTLSGADNQGWKMSEKYTGSPKRQKYTIGFTKESIHYIGGTATCSVAVKGSTTVYADGDGGSANDTAEAQSEYTINITNKSPVPVIRKISTTPLADAGSMYDTTFYYVNKPVRIYDASYDPEYQSYPSNTKKPTQQYVIKYKGLNALVSSDYDTVDYDKDLFSGVLQDKNNRTIDITFTESGYYTIQTSITDELGAQDVATKTIFVRNEPEPPTAVIKSSDYTFVNYPFPVKDASTDPNNDIIKWQWDKVVPASEETTGAVSGTLNNAEYPAEGNKPTNIGGTLQFSAPGEYKIGLAVTDATNLTNHTEKTIKVIRDIPVAIVEPGPESKDNPSDSDPHYETDPDDNIEKVYVKQNRKLILDASTSLNPPASPIIWDKTEWVYGNSDTDADYDMNCVKVDKSSNNKQQVILVKDVGEFKVTLTLHNKYSDELPSDDPDLSARTKVIIVKVLPDEDPLTTIQVNNANPNFHDNPQSVEVTLSGTATSPDNDFIDYYNWRVYRDNNNDGQYAENELQTQINNTKTTQVKSTVKFEAGNTSKFLSQVDAYERFGQETLDQFVTSGDIRHSSAEQEFEVNWRPCISYTIRDFAYVDDTLTITPTLRDENVETCTVEWTLMRKNKEGEYVAVDAASLPANGFGDAPIWQLGLHGGNIRITQDGYYRLDAVITDAEGHSEHFASEEIRIYDVPRAVISDKANYRWNGGAFQFKESRKFTLDGNASYVNDSTGNAKHQLNRALDEWRITPLDGQNAENIYVGATAEGTTRLNSTDSTCFNPGKNSFDEVLAILAPGRYRVDYRVTNTYGKRSPITTQEIIITEDKAPIIEGSVAEKVYRGTAQENGMTSISIGNLTVRSDDQDIINTQWTVETQYDADNDGFQNDAWQTVQQKYISIEEDTEQRVRMNVVIPTSNIGKYKFRVYAKDVFGQETLPIVPESKRKDATMTFDTEVDNKAPSGTFSTRTQAKADVVFAFGSNMSVVSEYSFGTGGTVMDAAYGTREITLPAGAYKIECWGAAGGASQYGSVGGNGAYATGELTLPNQTTLTVNVGGEGGTATSVMAPLGYNGGGNAWFYSGSGGGCSDVWMNGKRIIVAAGAGGGGNRGGKSDGGYGGGTTEGGSGLYNGFEVHNGANQSEAHTAYYSKYLKQTMDGSNAPHGEDFGHGGAGGGGGAGYAPGRCGGPFNNAGGGGGTSYLSALLVNAKAIAGNTTFLSPSGDNETGHNGNGYVRITPMSGESHAMEEIRNYSRTFANRFESNMDVNVELVETTKIDAQTSFPWEVYNLYNTGFGSGDGQFSPSGNTYVYRGYGSEAPIDHLYYDDGRSGSREFTFDIDMTGYNSCAVVIPGFMFGTHYDATTNLFTGYAVMMWHTTFGVYKFTSTDGHRGLASDGPGNIATTYASGDYDCGSVKFELLDKVSTVTSSLQKHVNMKYENGTLTITDSGAKVLSKKYASKYNGYGIFAANSGHGCGQRSYTQFNNFSLQTTAFKTLNDALSDVSWRDGAERFVIFTNDDAQTYLSPNQDSDEPNSYAELLTNLLDSNVHLIALGSANCQAQMQYLVNQLVQKSMYANDSPSATAMSRAEEFIKSFLSSAAKDTMYVLVNERLNYNKIYNDINGDPQWIWTAAGDTPYVAVGAAEFAAHFRAFQDDPSLLAQKWHYFHNPTYYDNSQGIASFNATSEDDDKWIAHEVNVFDKVGKYEVDYRIKDNPVPDKSDNSPGNPFHEYRYWSQDYAANKTDSTGHVTNPHAVIYVHRRPLAKYDFVAHKVNDVVDSVDITNNAYDLDHEYSDANKGLNLYEWKWKFASDSGWRGDATFDSATDAEAWINSQLKNLREQGMTNILVQYRVRDIDGPAEVETLNITHKTAAGWKSESDTTVRNQGAWSLPSVHWITNAAQPPVARFDTNNTVFGLGENVTVTDRSYSPNGDNIIKWEWTIERSTGTKTTVSYEIGSNVTSVSQMETLFSNYLTKWIDGQPIGTKSADNSYKVTLVVTDDKPQRLTSDPYSVTVKITPENTAPTVDPPKGNSSLFSNDNPTVYEYDDYDANQTNPYYTYNGRIQKRGTETLDWSLAVDDPDNYDKYGTGNDSNSYKIQFATDRFLKSSRTGVAEGATGVEHKTYDVRTVTKEQAANSVNVAPYSSAQAGNIAWGAYRITASVTDVPNNDSTPKTTELVTNADKKPLHLYVIPKLSLSTPHFNFDGVQDNQVQIPTGESVTITCTTNDRSTGARILYKDGDGHSFRQEMTLVKTVGETSYWTAEFVIPDNLEAEDLVDGEYYYYQIETYTTYGSRGGEESRTKVANGASPIHILPIKLYDFTVTNITDPSVVFGDAATARDLAYDRTNSQNGALMKLGYAFNFDVYSKGMKDKDDYVRIRPTFYGYNSGTGRYDMQLDMYYLNEVGEYVLATTSPDAAAASGDDYVLKTREFFGRDIGSLRELKLSSGFCTKVDRNTQKWSARYGVPGTAVFVTKGRALTENSMYLGDVVIRFDIEAMKHGVAKYNYISKGQWRIERTGGSGTILNAFKTKYFDGDVIVIDGVNNAEKDFETRPVWTKLR